MKSTARRLHTILLAFIVSLSLTFAGVQTQAQVYAEDYDETADGPAIEIVCKNYVYTPFYHDSNKSFTIVSGSSVEKVYQNDPLFILGITGSKKMPLYFCEGKTWVDDQTYANIKHFFT